MVAKGVLKAVQEVFGWAAKWIASVQNSTMFSNRFGHVERRTSHTASDFEDDFRGTSPDPLKKSKPFNRQHFSRVGVGWQVGCCDGFGEYFAQHAELLEDVIARGGNSKFKSAEASEESWVMHGFS